MIFEETKLPGAYRISLQRMEDDRGFFARTWCKDEFTAHGLTARITQCNLSYSKSRGTLRGMHYQRAPHAEAKVVHCARGAIYDVIVDLREDSRTYLQWLGVELTAENRDMLYVPEGFAHGFVTLTGDTEVAYEVSEFYTPGVEGGIRYDDPAIGIAWPEPVTVVSTKDATWPLLEQVAVEGRTR
jgi:dTDP-4-dehydrorhamnose 3,5-epimerase